MNPSTESKILAADLTNAIIHDVLDGSPILPTTADHKSKVHYGEDLFLSRVRMLGTLMRTDPWFTLTTTTIPSVKVHLVFKVSINSGQAVPRRRRPDGIVWIANPAKCHHLKEIVDGCGESRVNRIIGGKTHTFGHQHIPASTILDVTSLVDLLDM